MPSGFRQAILAGAAVLLGGSLTASCASKPEPADLVLRHGKVVTMDSAQPEAAAIAVKAGTIVAIGTNDEIAEYVGPSTEVLDLGGKLAIPGFIEGHGHFVGVGDALMQLRLATAQNWDEIVAMVGDAANKARPGEWIRGRGWHQEKWDKVPTPNVEGFPLHQSLDAVSPNNPVLLRHAGTARTQTRKRSSCRASRRRPPIRCKRALHGPGHQEDNRRSARLTRCLAPRAVHRLTVEPRPERSEQRRSHAGRSSRDGKRLPDGRARHRRSREPGGPEYLRAALQAECG